ncbi:hypothetical protein NPIL_160631 [Nephila pilipes]|uniref:Uncharacterized protein n=1 Tax=Nephila pilipes TaxID=299642 RepID=A0A8X6TC82_NEPPI|nr:hypothetical protein NPIL_160631 [Nephila pilipes]
MVIFASKTHVVLVIQTVNVELYMQQLELLSTPTQEKIPNQQHRVLFMHDNIYHVTKGIFFQNYAQSFVQYAELRACLNEFLSQTGRFL